MLVRSWRIRKTGGRTRRVRQRAGYYMLHGSLRCCKAHDECYDKIETLCKSTPPWMYTISYEYECTDAGPYCFLPISGYCMIVLHTSVFSKIATVQRNSAAATSLSYTVGSTDHRDNSDTAVLRRSLNTLPCATAGGIDFAGISVGIEH